jgi:pimeloyl-ACP methyl ester carboxylesterase
MADLRRHKADVNGVRLHYVAAGNGEPVVLVHGFPQTWYEWRRIIPALAERFTVIAPDYRGAGHSSRPVTGYDKRTMATDLRELVRHLGFERAAIVGHDIGLMVAYSYAAQFPEATSKLVAVDAPLPGTKVWDRISVDPRVWHFAFHGARDVAEMLVFGRERPYLQAFFNARSFVPVSDADLDVYVSAYSAPGAMRAGFELYRAFDQDAADNRAALERNGKLTVPVLAVGGEISTSGELVEEMMREVAEHVTGVRVPGTAHWVAEENPEAFLAALLDFLRTHRSRASTTDASIWRSGMFQ